MRFIQRKCRYISLFWQDILYLQINNYDTMEFSAQQIATYLSGTIEGNPEAVARTFAKIEEGEAGALSFLANPKYTHHLYETQSSIVLVNKDLQLE
ncbi:MAG: UDP-3-O-(3-hydroxymyristoyl)glucosamine N-acyltransferase, partial [Alloprevotella sp.]|nr:UDP-3-O-(3-hydroxymyristoyl)glucosamine N-acyltransferase [Alloprevotella sp.]